MMISRKQVELNGYASSGSFEQASRIRLIVSHGPDLWRAYCVGGVSNLFPAFSIIRENSRDCPSDPPAFFLENAELGTLVVDAREYPNQAKANRLFESPTLFTCITEEHLKAVIALLRARLGRVIAGKVEWEVW